MSDQLSSSVFKMIVQRPRPCHEIGGFPAVPGVRLLVPCGSGYSFPSSHAVNNFALAAFLSYYYRRWTGIFMLYASLMALSRVVVGVHYPSDIAAGALFGVLCAVVLIAAWREVGRLFPPVRIGPQGEEEES
jgi:undecaprenyl-diphosphatase